MIRNASPVDIVDIAGASQGVPLRMGHGFVGAGLVPALRSIFAWLVDGREGLASGVEG